MSNPEWDNYAPKKPEALSLNAYQDAAKKTCVYINVNTDGERIAYCALSLAGEAGEVANLIKKTIRDHGFKGCVNWLSNKRHETDSVSDDVRDEIGDCLWYVAMLAHECGFTLEDIATRNLEKLAERYEK